MITDIMALARDVDRLFRARQDGRQMPQGDVDPQRCLWVPHPTEAAAYRLAGLLDGYSRDGQETSVRGFWTAQGDFQCFTNSRLHLRTRRHVAMLALTEPAHFKACLAKLVDHYADKVERYTGALRDIGLEDHETDYRIEKTFGLRSRPKDVARTAGYLQDLDARLTEWREAEAVRAAIEARDREIAELDALAAAAQEPIPQEDEDAIMAIA